MHVVYSMFSWMLYSLTFGQDTPVSQQCANPPNLLFFLDWRYSLEGMEDYVGVFNTRHILPALFRAFYEIIYINCDLLFYHYTIQVLVVMKSHMHIGDRSTDAPLDASCGLNNVLCMESVPRQVNQTQPQTMNCNAIVIPTTRFHSRQLWMKLPHL